MEVLRAMLPRPTEGTQPSNIYPRKIMIKRDAISLVWTAGKGYNHCKPIKRSSGLFHYEEILFGEGGPRAMGPCSLKLNPGRK